jgi:hypothetical protein
MSKNFDHQLTPIIMSDWLHGRHVMSHSLEIAWLRPNNLSFQRLPGVGHSHYDKW